MHTGPGSDQLNAALAASNQAAAEDDMLQAALAASLEQPRNPRPAPLDASLQDAAGKILTIMSALGLEMDAQLINLMVLEYRNEARTTFSSLRDLNVDNFIYHYFDLGEVQQSQISTCLQRVMQDTTQSALQRINEFLNITANPREMVSLVETSNAAFNPWASIPTTSTSPSTTTTSSSSSSSLSSNSANRSSSSSSSASNVDSSNATTTSSSSSSTVRTTAPVVAPEEIARQINALNLRIARLIGMNRLGNHVELLRTHTGYNESASPEETLTNRNAQFTLLDNFLRSRAKSEEFPAYLAQFRSAAVTTPAPVVTPVPVQSTTTTVSVASPVQSASFVPPPSRPSRMVTRAADEQDPLLSQAIAESLESLTQFTTAAASRDEDAELARALEASLAEQTPPAVIPGKKLATKRGRQLTTTDAPKPNAPKKGKKEESSGDEAPAKPVTRASKRNKKS